MVCVDFALIVLLAIAGFTGLKLYFLRQASFGQGFRAPVFNLHFYIALTFIVLAAVHLALNLKVFYGRLKTVFHHARS